MEGFCFSSWIIGRVALACSGFACSLAPPAASLTSAQDSGSGETGWSGKP